MTGPIILSLWTAATLALAARTLSTAQRRHGVQVLSATFLAETATVGALVGAVIWGLSFFGVATGLGS